MKLDLEDPIALLLAAADALAAGNVEAVVYGGLALAAYGEPRETKDADLAVVSASGQQGCDALRRAGLDAQVTFDRVQFGGNLVSRVTLLPGGTASGLNTVDLVEPRSPRFARVAIDRAIAGTLRGREIRVVAPEDFIVLKALSTRERDLEDAATVLRSLGAQLDVALIDREVAALAAEVADHDVAGRAARIRDLARAP